MSLIHTIPNVDNDGNVTTVSIIVQGAQVNSIVGVYVDNELIDKVVTDDNGDVKATTFTGLSTKHKEDLDDFGSLYVRTTGFEVKATAKILAQTKNDTGGEFSLRYI